MIASITIPALVALAFKLMLLAYSVKSPTRNVTTRLFMLLLAVLALHNLVEFLGLNYFVQNGLTPTMQGFGFAYVAFLIPAIALILHVSLRTSLDLAPNDPRVRWQPLLYLPAAMLLVLLLGTDQLVQGFRPFQNTLLRVPGPLYFLFETYLTVYLLAALANLFYGARLGRTPIIRRTRNRWWLLAILPTGLLFVYLTVANHFGWTKITSTIYIPVTLTFFLIVTAYATHQYRLFDIEFFIPWSKVRRRKTAFYDRIRAMVAELADLDSVSQAIGRLAATLNCPVALVGGPRPVVAMAEATARMTDFPRAALQGIDHILIANEIADANPETSALMKTHGIAAIVPFYPYSRTAASWMLLGESFSDQVYTPLDFRIVEQLFDRMAELFLDKLVFMRAQLTEARQQLRDVGERLNAMEQGVAALRADNLELREQNTRLMQQHAAATQSSVLAGSASPAPTAAPDAGGEKTLDQYVAEFEGRLIAQALARCDGNKSKAARLLGLRPNTLHYKIERYGVSDKKGRG